MNVLIVDDEISAIKAVRNGVAWDRLEVSSIYTATGTQEAMEIFNHYPIDILLSDIEMPLESGLELLRWTNQHYPNVKCVFMTCHADFHFLQEALRLGSVDYILKPLDFAKVEHVLKQTIDKIRRERLLSENSNSWIQNRKTVVNQFWKDFFLGEISPNRDSLTNYFRQKRLDIDLDGTYVPILIVTKKWTENVSKEDQKLLQYGLRNITEELLVFSEAEREVFPFADASILVMLQLAANVNEPQLIREIEDGCRRLTAAAKHYLKEIVCCYIGISNTIYEMPAIIESLQEMDFNNVIHEPDVISLHSVQNRNVVVYTDTPVGDWREWLQQGRYTDVLEAIKKCLTSQEPKPAITRDYLTRFTRDFHYLIFGFATDRGVFINEMFGDEESNQLLEQATKSLDGLLQWISHAIDLMQKFDKVNANRDNPVVRTKSYIHQHLSEELTMDHIAKNVHLNADYLTRIFKKEVGVSISKYIINKKMERSKHLLIHTDKSIGEVAMLVGYYNYSSFNRIFNKEAGMSPQEFKNSHRNPGNR